MRGLHRSLGTALALLVVLWAQAYTRGEAYIRPENRVPNRKDYGVCMWAALESIAKETGVASFQNIVAQVLKTGVGRDGADDRSIAYWFEKTGTRGFMQQSGDRRWKPLYGYLDRGVPVVASISTGPDKHGRQTYHAIILLDVTKRKEPWRRANGTTVVDYVVRYLDPNKVDIIQENTWSWFDAKWTGKLVTLNPPVVAKPTPPPPPSPPRVYGPPAPVPPLPPAYAGTPPPKLVPASIVDRIVPNPGLHVRPHDAPFVIDHAVNPGPLRYPSNQDIKDGINRPSDTLDYGCYRYQNHDYYKR